jgi:hypothetical protein
VVHETPNDHEGNGAVQGRRSADGADAADDKKQSRHGARSAHNHGATAEAIDKRPGHDVASKLDGMGDLSNGERVIDTGKAEVVAV